MDNQFLDTSQEIVQKRRNLPHWEQSGKMQSVTFHLADSVPKDRLNELIATRSIWLQSHPQPWDAKTSEEFLKFEKTINKWLDSGYGSCVLANVNCAQILEDSLFFYDGSRYLIHAYVIMPNHVHLLISCFEGVKLSDILRNIKGFTAREINKLLNLNGQLWHHESFDRLIRNKLHYLNFLEYIGKNISSGGVRWGLPEN